MIHNLSNDTTLNDRVTFVDTDFKVTTLFNNEYLRNDTR